MVDSLVYVFIAPANVVVSVLTIGSGLDWTEWEKMIGELSLSFELLKHFESLIFFNLNTIFVSCFISKLLSNTHGK